MSTVTLTKVVPILINKPRFVHQPQVLDRRLSFSDTLEFHLYDKRQPPNVHGPRRYRSLSSEEEEDDDDITVAMTPINFPSIQSLPRDRMVALRRVQMKPGSHLFRGSVLVKNVGFDKHILIRWSTNQWSTWLDTEAHFLRQVDADIDEFVFDLNIQGTCLEFAICFQALGTEYWDNNFEQNYKVQFSPDSSPELSRDDEDDDDEKKVPKMMFKTQQPLKFKPLPVISALEGNYQQPAALYCSSPDYHGLFYQPRPRTTLPILKIPVGNSGKAIQV
jgi:hypothetical protein